MAVAAGKSAVVIVSTTGTFGATQVAGINNADVTLNGEALDTTSFANNAGYRQRALQGLKEFTVSLSGDYDGGDTTGQNVIRSAWVNGTDLYVKVLPDGTNGWSGKVQVTSINTTPTVDGKAETSFELVSDGAVTVI